MKYDPAKHHRRSIRLKGFDYASPGAYFVTIVVRNRECLLGEVTAKGETRLNDLGEVVRAEWEALPGKFRGLALDQFVIMPNHLHGVLVLQGEDSGEGGAHTGPRKGEASANRVPSKIERLVADASPLPIQPVHGTQPGSLAAVVQNFKSVSSRRINARRQTPGVPFWQRNYWEHVVRTTSDLAQIRAYIQTNPACWAMDQLYHTDNGKRPNT